MTGPASPEGPDEELRERIVTLPDEAHRFIDGEWWVRSTDVRAALSRTATEGDR